MTRICKACGVEKPLDQFNVGKGYAGGRRPQCKPCQGIYEVARTASARAAKTASHRQRLLEQKSVSSVVCTTCGETKPRDAFAKDERGRHGVARCCIDCKRVANNNHAKAKYASDPDAARARHRAVYWKRVDHYRAYACEKARDRIQRDPDAYNAYQRESYAKSPHRMREAARKRRSLKAGAPAGGVSADQWNELLEYFDNRCAYCLCRSDKLELDHVEPLARGGEHRIENAVPACDACNTSKNDKLLLEIFDPRLIIAQRMTSASIAA